MGITKDQFQLMVESLTSDMIQYLVETQGQTLRQAIDTVYGSDLHAALCIPATGLYNQSAGYVIEYLTRELRDGRL